MPRTRTTVGLSALPDGRAWYEFQVRAITGWCSTPRPWWTTPAWWRGVPRIARRMDAPWPLLIVPYPVADFFYDLLAKNRYRIFGKLDACMIPPAEVRARFLD